MKKFNIKHILLGLVLHQSDSYIGNDISEITVTPRQFVLLNTKTHRRNDYYGDTIKDISGFKWSLLEPTYNKNPDYVRIIGNLAEHIHYFNEKVSYKELMEILNQLNTK